MACNLAGAFAKLITRCTVMTICHSNLAGALAKNGASSALAKWHSAKCYTNLVGALTK